MKKLYEDQDINDIVEAESDPDAFFKGGPGSGRKGHKTAKVPNLLHHTMKHRMDVSDLQDLGNHLGLDTSHADNYDDEVGDSYDQSKNAHEDLVAQIHDHVEKNPEAKEKAHKFLGLKKSDTNDLVEELIKGGPGSGQKGHTSQKLKEIHAYHKEHSDEKTQESMKRYLNPEVTDPASHQYRVDVEHATMKRRPSIKKSSDDLEKGGPGSGQKGHVTPGLKMRRGDSHTLDIASLAAHVGRQPDTSKPLHHQRNSLIEHGVDTGKIEITREHNPQMKEHDTYMTFKKSEDLEKGGAGSGQKGHTTVKLYVGRKGELTSNKQEAYSYQHEDQAKMHATSMGDGHKVEPSENGMFHHVYKEHVRKSIDDLVEDLVKGGEGSRGGKVIGHTRSGKPIYDSASHPAHASFDHHDHQDAMAFHAKLSQDPKNKQGELHPNARGRVYHQEQSRAHELTMGREKSQMYNRNVPHARVAAQMRSEGYKVWD